MGNRSIGWLFASIALICLSCQATQAQTDKVFLTEEESAYLEQLGPVSMCVDPDWRPFEYLDEEGNFAGIAADLLQIISDRTGVEFEVVTTASWDESLEFSQSGDCVVLPFLNQTPDREEWLAFTEPYFTDYNVFITREEHDYIPDPALLIDKTVVLPSGTSIEERLRRNYPNLDIMLVESEADALYAVNNRDADMTLRSLTMAAYVIKDEGWFNLKIAGQLPDLKNRLRIGVMKEHALLVDILNRGIATITPQEVQQAVNNHVAITIVTEADYTWVLRILIGLVIVVAVGLVWNYQLRRLNKKLSSSQKELIQVSDQLKRDIAEREQVEAKLKNRERQLSNLVSNLPGLVYHCLNDEQYTMKFISKGCRDITGYDPEDFIDNKNKAFADVIFPGDMEKIREAWGNSLNNRENFELEYRIIDKNENIRWVWERGQGIFDDDGKVIALEGFITDVTAKRLAEERLAHQNTFYQLISEISAGFINSSTENIDEKIDSMLEKTGHFLAVDRTFLFQFSEDEQYMSNTHEWCAEGIIPVKDTVQNYPVRDVPIIAEIVRKKEMFFVPDVDQLPEGNDKEELKVQQVQSVLCLPIVKGNSFLGYYGFDSVRSKRNIDEVQMGLLQVMANILGDALLRNIIELEKKKTEADLRNSEAKLRELNAQKDKFFSIIAHDLKSPFNSILGFSELLLSNAEEKDYESAVEYARIVKQSSEKAINLLNNLLEWARTQTGRVTYNPEYFELISFVHEISSLFDAVAAQKSIVIKRELPHDLPVFADKEMISTVMRNLISNAIKFTNAGGEVVITANKEHDQAVVSVQDNGIGIPQEKICKVFRLAESESTPGTSNEKGTGLGLILCKEFIEAHGGKIWVKSRINEGSTFTFTIPQK